MKRLLVTMLLVGALCAGVTPLMGGCSQDAANVLQDASNALDNISHDINGDSHPQTFWEWLTGQHG